MNGFEVEVGKARIYVGPSLFRKSLTLGITDGSVHYTCAYFRNQEEAERFLTAIAGREIKFEADE